MASHPHETHRSSVTTLVGLLFLSLFAGNLAAAWQEVTTVTVNQSTRFYDRVNRIFYTQNSITNTGTEPISGPVRLVVIDATPAVSIRNADGTTDNGEPYFDLSTAADYSLAPGATSADVRMEFNRRRGAFSYRIRVENQPPAPAAPPSAIIEGRVEDTAGNPVPGAVVKIGENTVYATTDENGHYQANIGQDELNGDGKVVVSTDPDGYTSYQTKADVALQSEPLVFTADLQVKAVTTQQVVNQPQSTAIQVSAEEQGQAKADLKIPAGALVDDTGSPVGEPVTVELTTLDPTTKELGAFTGGDFVALVAPGQGQGPNGDQALLETVVLAEVKVTGNDTGTEYSDLQGAATLDMRLPDSEQGKYVNGQEIPLWYYDEDQGAWIQEGTGTVYTKDLGGVTEQWVTASVHHFTWWNIDWPRSEHTCWKGRLIRKGTGQPIPNLNLQAEGITYYGSSLGDRDGEGNVCVSVKRSQDAANPERVVFFIQYGGVRNYLVHQADNSFSLTTDRSQATVYANSTQAKSCFNQADRPLCDLVAPTPPTGFLAGDVVIDMNRAPLVTITPQRTSVKSGFTTHLVGSVADPDGDAITCSWSGTGLSNVDDTPAAPSADWTAPATHGPYTIHLECSDALGAQGFDEVVMQSVANNPPEITQTTADPDFATGASPGQVVHYTATCVDPDGDGILGFEWRNIYATGGTLVGGGESGPSGVVGTAQWTATGRNAYVYHEVRCQDTNSAWGPWTQIRNRVVNQAPVIDSLTADPTSVDVGGTTQVTVVAHDPDGHIPLSYHWYSSAGTISGSGTTVAFTPNLAQGSAGIRVTVSDVYGESSTRWLYVTVDNQGPVTVIHCDNGAGGSETDGPGDTNHCTATATDPNGDAVSQYQWSSWNSTLSNTADNITDWTLGSGGTSTISARAQDVHGAWGAWTSHSLTVNNQPPVVNTITCTGPARPYSVLNCTADTSDPDGDDIAQWHWSLVNGYSLGSAYTTVDTNTWMLPASGTPRLYVQAKDQRGAWGAWKSTSYATIQDTAPVVTSLVANPTSMNAGEVAHLTAMVQDAEGDGFRCRWSENAGGVFTNPTQTATGCEVDFSVPAGSVHSPCVQVEEDFGNGHFGPLSNQLCVDIEVNNAPEVSLTANPRQIDPAGTSNITAVVTDPEGDSLPTVVWTATCGDASLTNTSLNGALFTAPTGFMGACDIRLQVTDEHGASGSGQVRVMVGQAFVPDAHLVVKVVNQCGEPLQGVQVWVDSLAPGSGVDPNAVPRATDANGSADLGDQGGTDPLNLVIGREIAEGYFGPERQIVEYREMPPGNLTLVLWDSACGDPTVLARPDIQLAGSDGAYGEATIQPDLSPFDAILTDQEPAQYQGATVEVRDLDASGRLGILASDYDTRISRLRFGSVLDLDPANLPDPLVVTLDRLALDYGVSVADGNGYEEFWVRARRNGRDFDLGTSSWSADSITLKDLPGADLYLGLAQRNVGFFAPYAAGIETVVGPGPLVTQYQAQTLDGLPVPETGFALRFLDADVTFGDIRVTATPSVEVDFNLSDPAGEVDILRTVFRGYGVDGRATVWTVFSADTADTNGDLTVTNGNVPSSLADWRMGSMLGECRNTGYGYEEESGNGLDDVEVTPFAVTPGATPLDIWTLIQTARLRGHFDPYVGVMFPDAGPSFLALPTADELLANRFGSCDVPTVSVQGTLYDWSPTGSSFVPVPNCGIEVWYADKSNLVPGTESCDAAGHFNLSVPIATAETNYGDGSSDGFLLDFFPDAALYTRMASRRRLGLTDGDLVQMDVYGGLDDVDPATDEPNGTTATATPLTSPAQAGYLTAGDLDFFSVNLNAGDTLRVAVYGSPNNGSGSTKGYFGVFDASGAVETRCFHAAGQSLWQDCAFGANGEYPITFVAPTNGTYWVGIANKDDPGFTGTGGSDTGGYVIETSVSAAAGP